MRERILCLANSRKLGGHCIAGLTAAGKFVRLCGPDGALTETDTDLGLRGQPRVLDELRESIARHSFMRNASSAEDIFEPGVWHEALGLAGQERNDKGNRGPHFSVK